MLKLNRPSSLEKPQISYYAQGISAQCIHLENVTHWSIVRIIFISGKPDYYNLTRHFLAFQRRMKGYAQFLRSVRSLRVLRLREVYGKMPLHPPTGTLYTVG